MNPNHHRRSIRLKDYDYTRQGAYFITLVTFQRAEIFGSAANDRIVLSLLGQIAQAEWMRSIEMRCEIQLFEDEFVIMPNHIHGIVHILSTEGDRALPDPPVRAHGVRPDSDIEMGGARRAPQQPAPRPALERAPKSLGSFIAGYKSAVTSRAKRELGLSNIWQRNYYEHIIRNPDEYAAIWNYIDLNPQKWLADRLHK